MKPPCGRKRPPLSFLLSRRSHKRQRDSCFHKLNGYQICSMYSTPLHYDAYFEVIAVSQSGDKTFPMGECSSWSPRELYFIEGLFNADRSHADAFMAYLAATYKGNEKLSEVRIIMSRSFAPNYGSSPDNQPHQYIFY